MDKIGKVVHTSGMRSFLILIIALTIAGCGQTAKPIPPYTQSGELVVVTRNSPTTYYEDAGGQPAGIEHDLVELFAKELGVRVRFIVTPQFNEIIPTLLQQQAHFAAAGLTITPEREKLVQFITPYQTIQQQVAYNTNNLKPRSARDLIGKRIEVVAGSSYVERLEELRDKYPKLKWREVEALESEELLERVAEDEIDYAIADSNVIDISKTYIPNLDNAFNISPPQYLAWAFPKEADPQLVAKAKAFFDRIKQDGTLKVLIDRYYGHTQRLESADVAGILDKREALLAPLRKFFYPAQEISDIDWRLLAALAYQESHWDPLATSPTGVRGIMMLTEDTADRLGVSNRLDPRQSIRAGAKYLASLKDMLPARISEPDRTWLALAAYNMGYGHLEDGRILAQRMKMNPDSWADLKKVLPLLTQSAYYTKLKHGYGRGGQAVIFVESVRTYYDILVRFEKPHEIQFNLAESAKPGRRPRLKAARS